MIKDRIHSIDAFRALTMFMMLFVNDLPSNKNNPHWLMHAPAQADALGFSDIIFPAFLFIVGLSIPLAIRARKKKGQSKSVIFKHIVIRSVALIVMGFFHVNWERYSADALLPGYLWIIIVTIAFFLIWLKYPKTMSKKHQSIFKGIGILLLITMAGFYTGEAINGTNYTWMRTSWWGILGLIGWAYFVCATLALYTKQNLVVLGVVLTFFVFFNSASLLGWVDFLNPITKFGFFDFGNASSSTLVMMGIVTTAIYQKSTIPPNRTIWIIAGLALLYFLYGFVTRPLWGISKIRATPSWTTICGGISVLTLIILIFLVDIKGKKNWFKLIKPAGTNTLTCYLLPYLYLALFVTLLNIRLPIFFRTGSVGIIKSLLFALLIVCIGGIMEKNKLKLKI